MKTMKDFCPKPSDALQAMLDGLREIPGPNFKVDMLNYGHVYGDICYGCAATCAIQKATEVRLTPYNIKKTPLRAEAYNVELIDLIDFESALDEARMGRIDDLLRYYGYTNLRSICRKYEIIDIYLFPKDYHLQYDKLEAAIAMLKSYDL